MARRPNEDPENRRRHGGAPVQLTWDKFVLICEQLAETGSKYKAAEALAFNYSTVQRAIREREEAGDDTWRERWDEAYDQFRDKLEQEAVRRHVEGVSTDYYDKEGNHTHTKVEYSDRMGELLLKGHFPERYRDKVFHSGTVGLEPVDAFANLSTKAKREIRAIIMRDLEEQRELAAARGDPSVIEHSAAIALEDLRQQGED